MRAGTVIAEGDVFTTMNGGRARIVHVNDGPGDDHPVIALVAMPGVRDKRCITYTRDGRLIDGQDTSLDLDSHVGRHEPAREADSHG